MAKKHLLTLDDLVAFFSNENKSFHFNSLENEGNEEIVVHVDGTAKFEADNSQEGLLAVKLQANHTGKNRNGSFISEESQIKALSSFQNRPILGYIHEVDGVPHFYGHNMHEEDDSLVYDESPIGHISETAEAKIVYDEEKDKSYVEVSGYIYEEYTKAAEILRREKELPVSVELYIRDFAYNADEKALQLEDFYYSGVTILGKDEDGNDVEPGMEGSNIQLVDFSAGNNAVFSGNKTVVEEELSEEQVVEFEEESVESVEEPVEELSEENLEEPAVLEESEEEPSLEEVSEEVNAEELSEGVLTNEELEEHDLGEEAKLFSFESFIKKFELTLDEVSNAVYNLVYATWSEDEWWRLDIYEDKFIAHGYFTEKHYRQKYKRNGDVFSLDGDRVELFAEYLTAEEVSALNDMRSNYSTLKDQFETVNLELDSYKKKELDEKKMSVLNSEDYSEFLNEDEFKALTEHLDDYSLEELGEKAELAFAKCVRKASFMPKKEVREKHIFTKPEEEVKKDSPYGNLFDE